MSGSQDSGERGYLSPPHPPHIPRTPPLPQHLHHHHQTPHPTTHHTPPPPPPQMEALLISNIKPLSPSLAEYHTWTARVKDLLCYLELWPIPPSPVRSGHGPHRWPANVEVPAPAAVSRDHGLPTYSAVAEAGQVGGAGGVKEQAERAERRRLKTVAVIRACLSDSLFLSYAVKEFDDPAALWGQLKITAAARGC
ncbi:hypothetical protein BZA05DRAFT_20268 [Tricharina praecox]|uniref:uncharacterized protein n=1 Tax=Tricharina praecox TaxID=43433 RepID=UPI002220F618|nr:uncharacterized protein BZA05DRAFT_20268 [Tricharina praecox]KAI5859040.1 hypothetical protein BZA05DRAFT_20268 [Tricharina praecox]